MRKKKKKIIYLDQFASSNLAAANEDSLWCEIRIVIERLVNKGFIFCPLSPEHYVETSGRDYQHANAQTAFFQTISGGLIFNTLEIIISNEIANLVRTGENKFIRSCYLKKTGNIMVFENVDQYRRLYSYKTNYNDFIKTEHRFVNELRKENKQHHINTSNINILQKACISLSCQKIIKRLEEVYNNGRIIIQGVTINNIEYPNQIDCVIYNLMKFKQFRPKDIQTLIRELDKYMFERIPSLYIKYSLQSLWAIDNTQQTSNDIIDLERAASALAISDYYFTDYKRKNELMKLGIDTKYNTSIYSAKECDLELFLNDLNNIET